MGSLEYTIVKQGDSHDGVFNFGTTGHGASLKVIWSKIVPIAGVFILLNPIRDPMVLLTLSHRCPFA